MKCKKQKINVSPLLSFYRAISAATILCTERINAITFNTFDGNWITFATISHTECDRCIGTKATTFGPATALKRPFTSPDVHVSSIDPIEVNFMMSIKLLIENIQSEKTGEVNREFHMVAIQISNHLPCTDRCNPLSMPQIHHKISQVKTAGLS